MLPAATLVTFIVFFRYFQINEAGFFRRVPPRSLYTMVKLNRCSAAGALLLGFYNRLEWNQRVGATAGCLGIMGRALISGSLRAGSVARLACIA